MSHNNNNNNNNNNTTTKKPINPSNIHIPKQINQLQIQKQIGSGAFSTVYLATTSFPPTSVSLSRHTPSILSYDIDNIHNNNNTAQIALKVIPKSFIESIQFESKLQQEIMSLKKCTNHLHVITLYNVILLQQQQPHTDLMILMTEYCSGGELHDYIERRMIQQRKKQQQRRHINNKNNTSHYYQSPLPPKQTKKYFQQIISAISYLHYHIQIAHRDLKLENILLDTPPKIENNNIKLADFGFSCPIIHGEKRMTLCGSPYYAAPELLNVGNKSSSSSSSPGYDCDKVDVYSTGVILYVLLCGTFPFIEQNNNTQEMYTNIQSGNYILPSHLQKNEKELIQSMMEKDPMKRIDIENVLNESEYYKKDLPFYLKRYDDETRVVLMERRRKRRRKMEEKRDDEERKKTKEEVLLDMKEGEKDDNDDVVVVRRKHDLERNVEEDDDNDDHDDHVHATIPLTTPTTTTATTTITTKKDEYITDDQICRQVAELFQNKLKKETSKTTTSITGEMVSKIIEKEEMSHYKRCNENLFYIPNDDDDDDDNNNNNTSEATTTSISSITTINTETKQDMKLIYELCLDEKRKAKQIRIQARRKRKRLLELGLIGAIAVFLIIICSLFFIYTRQ